MFIKIPLIWNNDKSYQKFELCLALPKKLLCYIANLGVCKHFVFLCWAHNRSHKNSLSSRVILESSSISRSGYIGSDHRQLLKTQHWYCSCSNYTVAKSGFFLFWQKTGVKKRLRWMLYFPQFKHSCLLPNSDKNSLIVTSI